MKIVMFKQGRLRHKNICSFTLIGNRTKFVYHRSLKEINLNLINFHFLKEIRVSRQASRASDDQYTGVLTTTQHHL